ncbi:MAG: hypothetical protein PHC88_02930 [Terrimicrobiaceae bacterium]|nr:hypothetical protein [Terrimicrobiaceae bacterium]
MNTCILISTCEKYRSLTDFTRARIQEFWKDAPPLRLCGISGDPCALPLHDDPRDWMKVVRSACDALMADGFAQAYLILDDHPPLGRCHAAHLNETLPAMMRELGAVSISLSGYGQGRATNGKVVKWRDWQLDRCLPDTLWKYPLHPALWRLDALRDLLDRLIAGLPESEHTPWAFERRGGAKDAGLPAELTMHSYRIEGRAHAAIPYPGRLERFKSATDLYRFLVRKFAGETERAAVDERILGAHHYYHGPYPLIWSGLMRKGAVNRNALFFLSLVGRNDWVEAIQRLTFE